MTACCAMAPATSCFRRLSPPFPRKAEYTCSSSAISQIYKWHILKASTRRLMMTLAGWERCNMQDGAVKPEHDHSGVVQMQWATPHPRGTASDKTTQRLYPTKSRIILRHQKNQRVSRWCRCRAYQHPEKHLRQLRRS